MFVEKSSQLGKRGFRLLHNFTRMCFFFLQWTSDFDIDFASQRWKGGVRGEGGHAWWRGACMVKGACVAKGGHAWQRGGGMRGIRRDTEIRSMSGRYASYWNAFLFFLFCSVPTSNSNIISGGSTIDRPDGEENSQETPEQNLGILYFASDVNSLFHCKLITLQPRLHYKICETLTF